MHRQSFTPTPIRRSTGVAIVALLLVASPAAAQSPAPLLVDANWLSEHANDRDLVVLHVGPKADYDTGHVPGARQISEDDVSAPHDMSKMASGDLMLELPAVDVLRAKVAALGISDNSRIVVYSGKTGALQSSTRIVFTLDYLGLGDRTSLLNGGISAWTQAGHATTTQVPTPVVGVLTTRPTRNVVADAALVKSIPGRPNFRLVDARAAVFYRGIDASMGEKGHIPGAISIPFSQITDNNQMIDKGRVAELFEAAGIKRGDTLVAYCHVGQQATAVVFAARLLGYTVMLYDGSFQDWTYNVHGPVEK